MIVLAETNAPSVSLCLQVYNVGQVKQRLQTAGLYIANTRPGGFTMEVIGN